MQANVLILPAFIAGVLTFLAPCTLPLVPGFLGFLGGASGGRAADRKRMLWNSLWYVVGFSGVFILFGTLFGLGGGWLAAYRLPLTKLGGFFLVLFGLATLGLLRLPTAGVPRRLLGTLTPGNWASSFILGAVFALGWTPCAGPILGAVLTLAAASATVGEGAFLLFVFSLGLAVPFMLMAFGLTWVARFLPRFAPGLRYVTWFAGGLLIVFGLLLIFGRWDIWLQFFGHLLPFGGDRSSF